MLNFWITSALIEESINFGLMGNLSKVPVSNLKGSFRFMNSIGERQFLLEQNVIFIEKISFTYDKKIFFYFLISLNFIPKISENFNINCLYVEAEVCQQRFIHHANYNWLQIGSPRNKSSLSLDKSSFSCVLIQFAVKSNKILKILINSTFQEITISGYLKALRVLCSNFNSTRGFELF